MYYNNCVHTCIKKTCIHLAPITITVQISTNHDITSGVLIAKQRTTVGLGQSPTRHSDYAAMSTSFGASMHDKNDAVLRYAGPVLRHTLLTLNI